MTSQQKQATIWTAEQVRDDARAATAIFVASRTDEPVQNYLDEYEKWEGLVSFVVQSLSDFLTGRSHQRLIDALFASPASITALRYVTAPPVSEDDLETATDVTLAPTKLRSEPERREKVRAVLERSIDPIRFPWIGRGDQPTEDELETAVLSTLVLLASQRVQTERRSQGMKGQEKATKAALEAAGYTLAQYKKGEAPPQIDTMDDWPPIGTYIGEKVVAGTRADVIVHMRDGRLLLIECKASNSEVNSVKRLNRESQGKGKIWSDRFPNGACVPASVISGVFKPSDLIKAQGGGVALFWEHRISDLTDFVS